jgi:hypothetical protein
VFIEDARWIESKNAEILLDIHGPTLKGEDTVRDAVQRAVDQVQLIHDQTLRLISHGLDGRQAAESVYMPRHLRGDWENYGQVESHVRQVYNGTLGWFGGDVYEINPLSENEEASRTVQMMGGPAPSAGRGERQLAGRARKLAVDAPADVAAARPRCERRRGAQAPGRGGPCARPAHLGGQRARLVPDGGAANRRRDEGQGPTRDARRDPPLPGHTHCAGARCGIRGREPAVRALPRRSAQGRGAAPGSRSPWKATRASGDSSCATACS